MTGIYKITNPEGKIYIGQSMDVEKRFLQHKMNTCGLKLRTSISVFGFDNHKFEIIEKCEKSELNDRELFYIELFDTFKNGLNTRGARLAKETNNDRYAGRKPKYNVPLKTIKVPVVLLNEIEELCRPYLTVKPVKKSKQSNKTNN